MLKRKFLPINYKLPGRDKVYSSIFNACFESLIESNNEDLTVEDENSCIVVAGDGSAIKS